MRDGGRLIFTLALAFSRDREGFRHACRAAVVFDIECHVIRAAGGVGMRGAGLVREGALVAEVPGREQDIREIAG
jgi:hypothetical protein